MYVAMIANVLFRKTVTILELPYVPFARQDRATTPEQPFSLRVFCNFLNNLQLDELIVSDVHSDVFFTWVDPASFKVTHLSQVECLDKLLLDRTVEYDCVIAPDKGAMKKAKQIADGLLGAPLICATKVRDPLTGQLSSPTIDFGDLKPKRALIPDDLLDAGGTFIQLADVIKQQFPDIKLDLYVTHGIFSRGTKELKKRFESIYVYNNMSKEVL